MAARIVRIPERHADRILAGLAVLAAACGVIVGVGEDRLTLGGSGAQSTPLVIRVSGTTPLRFGPNRVAIDVMRARLEATPGVTKVNPPRVSSGARTTSIIVRFSDDPKESAAAVATIETDLDPGPLQISFSGGASELRDARDQTFDDLRLLLIAVPLAALILVAALGSRAALATVFAGAAAVLGAGAACIGVSLFIDLSVLCLVGAAAGGVPASIFLCGLERRGVDPRALLAASLGSTLVFASLAALGVGYLAALALGGALACLLAAPAAMVAIGAATALWQLEPSDETGVQRVIGGLVSTLSWNRAVTVAIAVLSAGFLAVVALSATRLDPGAFAAPGPPSISTERGMIVAGMLVAALFATGWIAGRRPLPALVGALTVPLAPAAGAGLAVIVFQDGHLESLLDFEAFSVGVGPLAAGAATVAAVAAAQGLAGVGTEVPAYPRVATVAAAASTITALAAACLLGSSLEFAKAFGLIVAAGLLLDLIFVRGLIGAALAALASRRDGSLPADG